MTICPLTQLIDTPVPVRVMTAALILASRLGPKTFPALLPMIVKSQAGTHLTAEAIQLRLSLLAMLLAADPAFNAVTAKLEPPQIGAVLAEFPLRVRDGVLDFDGDALAEALRLAAQPEGAA